MPTGINTELLVAVTGAAMVVAGVLVGAWAARKKEPAPGKPGKPFRRAKWFTAGVLLTVIGAYTTLKKYLDDSGLSQWIQSMMDWLIPVLGTTLIVVGAAVVLWALFADRSRGRKRCPRCWYDMGAVPGLVCPECGKEAKRSERLNRTRRHWRQAAFAMLLILLGSLQFAEPWYRRGGWLPWIPTRVLIWAIPSYESTRSRMMWELERRIAIQPQAGRLRFRDLPHLAPMSESMRRDLARNTLIALERHPKHPARQLLFKLMPENLSPEDVGRAEPIMLAATSDPDTTIRLGAIATLRKVRGFDPGKSVNAAIAVIKGASGATVQGSDSGPIAEAIGLLGDSGGEDARVVPLLIGLIWGPSTPSFGYGEDVYTDVLWALARLGPRAKAAKDAVTLSNRRQEHGPTHELTHYTLAMISGQIGGRESVLLAMLGDEDYTYRGFAARELGKDPPTVAAIKALVEALRDSNLTARLNAADSLLMLEREQEAARALLDAEVDNTDFRWIQDHQGPPEPPFSTAEASLAAVPLIRLVDIFGRHKLDLTPIESKARELFERQKRNLQEAYPDRQEFVDKTLAARQTGLDNVLRRIADYRAGRMPSDWY